MMFKDIDKLKKILKCAVYKTNNWFNQSQPQKNMNQNNKINSYKSYNLDEK